MTRTIVGLALFVCANAWAGVQLTRAINRLQPQAPGRLHAIAAGYFAKKEWFTDEGWRYRNRAVMWNSLSVVVVAVVFLWPT